MNSIVSYPDRGHWGKSSWRGNTTGHIVRDLLTHFRPKYVVDPMEGSRTTGDVCRELNIRYRGFDLHSGFNALRDSLLSRLSGERPEFVFLHPPYHNMVVYSGEVWGKPDQHDLSRCGTADEFVEKLQQVFLNCYEALDKGGRYSVLIGDHRKNGEYRSYQADIIGMGIGKLESVIIKQQHNCVSGRTSYSGSFIPILHEYLIIFRKDGYFQIGEYGVKRTEKLSKQFYGTWKAVLSHILLNLGGTARLDEIYRACEGIETANQHIQAKIRQTLSRYFKRVGEGVYAVPAAA